MKKNETTKFELLFTLGGNIICQRYFNVKGYNPVVRRSTDLYDAVREVCESIQHDLKRKSVDFLFENEKFFAANSDAVTEGVDESFTLQIKLGEDTIIARQFAANIYPPKIRYTVDIRPEIRYILTVLTETLSQEDYNTEYIDQVL